MQFKKGIFEMNGERIILIQKYLQRNTDENRSVTIRDIQNELARGGIENVSPITIRHDIDRLSNMGYDISEKKGAHNTAYYSMSSKGFTFNEIRFIVDSVSINKFLSDDQKRRLIKKFEGMCSDAEIRQLISRVEIGGNTASQRDLLTNLDILHKLISQKHKVNFSYGKLDESGNMIFYDKDRELLPVKVIYFDDRFYMRCYDQINNNFRIYRVDRMKNITDIGKSSCKPPKFEKYQGFVADMFPPNRFTKVRLRVENYLLNEMLEQMGSYASSRKDFDDPRFFIINATVGINKQFYLWLMRYGEGVEILSPKDVRDEFTELLQIIFEKYSE